MKSGHGRVILRDGTELSIGYCFAQNESGSVCQGTLIGDIRSVDPGSFSNSFSLVLSGGEELVALATAYSDRHINFVGGVATNPAVQG
ncbi:hypothetical protein GGC47_004836 [Bosea sp. OAE752]